MDATGTLVPSPVKRGSAADHGAQPPSGTALLHQAFTPIRFAQKLLGHSTDFAVRGAADGDSNRIPPFRREVRHHRLQHLRQHGRGGVMVEVDHEAQGSQRPAKVQGFDIVDDLGSSNHCRRVEGQEQL